MIVVKAIKLGSPIRDIDLPDYSTLGNLLDKIGEQFIENSITINNSTVNRGTRLYDNDRIFIGNKTKGNIPFEVQTIRLGAASDGIINLPAEDGYTINQVLDQIPADKRNQFFGSDGKALYEYRVGTSGQLVDGTHVLSRPATGTVRLMLSTHLRGDSDSFMWNEVHQ